MHRSLSDMALRGALAKANGSTLMCVGKVRSAAVLLECIQPRLDPLDAFLLECLPFFLPFLPFLPQAREGSAAVPAAPVAGQIGESFYIATFRKKKLAIFSLDMAGGKEGATLLREVELSDTPVRLCMCGDSVCVAYTHEYRLFKNIAEGPVAETQLFACDKTNPYIVTMENESMLLSAEDMAMIVNADGMPCGAPLTLNAQVSPWPTAAVPMDNPDCGCKLTRVRPQRSDPDRLRPEQPVRGESSPASMGCPPTRWP